MRGWKDYKIIEWKKKWGCVIIKKRLAKRVHKVHQERN